MRRTAVPGWLVAAALLLPFLALAQPLLEVDDARYAEVPREMAVSGDWVLPTLDGMPYVEKPPLWYWCAAASYEVFGVSEASARLPLALFAILGALGIWWLGSWLYSPDVGRAAAAATASSALWVFLAHNMTLDTPLSALFVWTTALALRAMLRPEDAGWAAPAAWAGAGLAFLMKGLIAVLLPGLWVAGLAILFPRLRRGAAKLLSPLGIALFLALCLPWLVAISRRRPDFLHTFFIEQHFQRYLTARYHRGEAWWFYLAVVPAGLLPWTVPAAEGLRRALAKPLDPRGASLAAWILGVLAFFSVSHSKLATYALPVFPHACLLAAVALEDGLGRRAVWIQRGLGVLLIGAAACALLGLAWGLIPANPWLAPAPIAVAAGLLTVLVLALLAPPSARALCLGGTLMGALAFAGLELGSPQVSAKAVGLAIRAEARPGEELWTYGTYLHGLPFYAGRPVSKLVYFIGEFHYAKRDPRYAGRFGDDDSLRALTRIKGKRTFVVLHSGEYPHFIRRLGPKNLLSRREFGPWTLVEAGTR